MKIIYKINEKYNDFKLRDFLLSLHLGKVKIYNLISEKRISKDNILLKDNSVLKTGDFIEICYDEKVDFVPLEKKLDIVYEDDYFLFVNKPRNIIVHPDEKTKNGTMCNVVSFYYQNKGIEATVKYAHRLDIDTTGILMFAKDVLSSAYLHHIISTHELKRTYLCLCEGIFKTKKGTIDLPIGEDRHHNQRRRVSKTGQNAVTHYEVILEHKNCSLVKVVLETGRTHQIRVHMSYVGHPLVGDVLYGAKTEGRVMLHSYKVEFVHPYEDKSMTIVKDMPFDMKKLLK